MRLDHLFEGIRPPPEVYHGTPNVAFDRFNTNRGGMGGQLGHWFSSTKEAAQQFARERFAGRKAGIKVCRLRIEQPKEFGSYQEYLDAVAEKRGRGEIEEGVRSLRRSLIRQGYDGVVIRNSDTDMAGVRDDWVAFYPHQIEVLKTITNDSLNEAPQQWTTSQFRAWFGNSKVVDQNGQPLRVYHGAQRGDRIARANAFYRSHATSGPMAFFTDDPSIASGYAKSKADTSLPDDLDWRSLWVINGTQGLHHAWRALSPQLRAHITEHGWRIEEDETTGAYTAQGDDPYITEEHWKRSLAEARGNGLLALWDVWVNGGLLINSERHFGKVLRAAGVTGEISFDHPRDTYSAVFPVYLSIQNPLDTTSIPGKVITALKRVSKQRRAAARPSTDSFSKHSVNPQDWVQRLSEGDPYVWTAIPDWVTDTLTQLGYDGIKDQGGKGGGLGHTVWIPFQETQVKSALGNRGEFHPNDHRLTETNHPSAEALARWFAGSKIVDSRGQPLRLYHGTSKDQDFKSFKIPRNGAWFATDPREASIYAENNDSQKSDWDPWQQRFIPKHTAARIIPVFVRSVNPKHYNVLPDELRHAQNYKKAQAELFDTLRREGHDAVTIGYPEIQVVVVLGSPNQIKSAIGNRSFDPAKKGLTEASR